MTRSEKVTRRRVIQGGAGLVAAGTMGFPGILKAQDVLKFGHLTPLTAFLGPLGEFAQMGVKLALEEVNGAGGVMGRKVELVMEDSVNPQTASCELTASFEAGVSVPVEDIAPRGYAVDRASVRQKKTGRPRNTTHATLRFRPMPPCALPRSQTGSVRATSGSYPRSPRLL